MNTTIIDLEEAHQFDHYLRTNNLIEPLIFALVNVNIYRPDDPIEFIATCLIDWSRKKFESREILTTIETYREQCQIDDQRKYEKNQLNIARKKQFYQNFAFEYDRQLFALNQYDFYINPRTDDEREPLSNVQLSSSLVQQQFHGVQIQHLHTHETASGLNDQIINRTCHDGLPPSTYFSKLKDRLIKCDDITNQ